MLSVCSSAVYSSCCIVSDVVCYTARVVGSAGHESCGMIGCFISCISACSHVALYVLRCSPLGLMNTCFAGLFLFNKCAEVLFTSGVCNYKPGEFIEEYFKYSCKENLVLYGLFMSYYIGGYAGIISAILTISPLFENVLLPYLGGDNLFNELKDRWGFRVIGFIYNTAWLAFCVYVARLLLGIST